MKLLKLTLYFLLAVIFVFAKPSFGQVPDEGMMVYTKAGKLYVRSVNGTIKELEIRGICSHPAFSPSGKIIAYDIKKPYTETTDLLKYSISNIGIVKTDGNYPSQITNFSTGNAYQPTFSKDGKKILFAFDNNVWVMEADGSFKHQLNYSRTIEVKPFPCYSPSNQLIAFVKGEKPSKGSRKKGFLPTTNLWILNTHGLKETKVTDFKPKSYRLPIVIEYPQWINEETVIFIKRETNISQIIKVTLFSAEEPLVITSLPKGEVILSLKYVPQSNKIVYLVKKGDESELRVITDGNSPPVVLMTNISHFDIWGSYLDKVLPPAPLPTPTPTPTPSPTPTPTTNPYR